jgi:ribonucleoside-diphosphate reductase alpha chain
LTPRQVNDGGHWDTQFRTKFAHHIFKLKYAQNKEDNWDRLSERCVQSMCAPNDRDNIRLSSYDYGQLLSYIKDFKFIPGGRYLYYSGRSARFYNNCYLLRAEEDTREEWANLTWRAMSCLMTGGGIGIDYSRLRHSGAPLRRTGGVASGPIPLMYAINEIGRNVMQGGSRRSAIYASLNWQHPDIPQFLTSKNWSEQRLSERSSLTNADVKKENYNHPAPLDMTNISLNYDDAAFGCLSDSFVKTYHPEVLETNPVFRENCRQAMMTGEPGFSFNFGDKSNETLRNACTEVSSEDDSDVCNLGSIHLGNIDSLEDLKSVVHLATKFLICGTLRADLPYQKVHDVRSKNRRLGLGIMGLHEWLLKRGYPYEVVPELHKWLEVYRDVSDNTSKQFSEALGISRPVAVRAIAPTGSLAILASTTGGIEPLYAVAYKRRYLTGGTQWKYQYVIDSTAERLINEFGIDPDRIDTAESLAGDFERRIKLQSDVQAYVDMGISSTINLPPWGSRQNSESEVGRFASTLARYAPKLRGFTAYPSGARGGQPLEAVDYSTAKKHRGVEIEENGDVCSLSGKGFCGS